MFLFISIVCSVGANLTYGSHNSIALQFALMTLVFGMVGAADMIADAITSKKKEE
jgi:hypothetical protein